MQVNLETQTEVSLFRAKFYQVVFDVVCFLEPKDAEKWVPTPNEQAMKW